jgi:hypothetical protein
MPMGLSVAKLDVAFLGDMQGLLPLTMVYFPEDSLIHSIKPLLETLLLKPLDLTRKMSPARILWQLGLLSIFHQRTRPSPWPIQH